MRRSHSPGTRAAAVLIREATSATRRFIESRFGEIGIRLQYGLELNNNEAIKALVASNLGISILSHHAVRFELAAGNLAALRVKGLPLIRKLFLIACADARLAAGARALRAVLLAAGSVPADCSDSAEPAEGF